MTDMPEEQQAAARVATSTAEPNDTIESASASPARSDKSSDSEGKDVREKLKDTQIDTQTKPDALRSHDQPMNEATNGSAKIGDQSVSGSDSERGRLRRKRSREDFEDEADADKHSEKKPPGPHMRKRSMDIRKDLEAAMPVKPTSTAISSINETDTDEQMTSPSKITSAKATTDKASGTETSPKNKRTRDQIENDNEAATETSEGASANGKPVEKAQGEERNTKRLRDKEGDKSSTDVPAAAVGRAVAANTDASIRARVAAWTAHPVVTVRLTMMGGSPWFDAYGCDFGWGKPAAVRSGRANKNDGRTVLYPGWEGGGSVDAEVSLSPGHMAALELDGELRAAVSSSRATFVSL